VPLTGAPLVSHPGPQGGADIQTGDVGPAPVLPERKQFRATVGLAPVLNPLTFLRLMGNRSRPALFVFTGVKPHLSTGPDMIIQKSVIIAKLRERGLDVRADFVDRELPDEVDTLRFGGLLSTLNLDLKELQAPSS
jgi:hypothetical protein